MISNLEKYRKDLDKLIKEAVNVECSLLRETLGDEKYKQMHKAATNCNEEVAHTHINELKQFSTAYQLWYSEALVLIKQLLPDRLQDFTRLYEKPKNRKDVDYDTYRIEDACKSLKVTFNEVLKVDKKAAFPLLSQQFAMVEAVKLRFESSLFDIKQLVQADLFDSEIDAARELLKNKYYRAAGALAGVVLEGHLKQVCDNHNIPKKSGTITPMNEGLKAADVLDLAQYRHIQFLGDVRNKCGHKNTTDPTEDEVKELIKGVDKVIKTIF